MEGLLGISIDITERKEREKIAHRYKAEKSNQLKSDFVSNAEHDIRTLFVGVYGVINLLAERETDPNKKSLLSEAALCAKTLLNHCDEILSFSRIEK